MVVRFSRLVGGGSLGGVRLWGERVGKEREKKERKDREETEKKGKKICFGFSILVRVKNPILYPSKKMKFNYFSIILSHKIII